MNRLMIGLALIVSLVSFNARAIEVNAPITGAKINWEQFGTSYAIVANNSSFSYAGGKGTVSSLNGNFQVLKQGSDWGGNMPLGEYVLSTYWTGPDITLNFDQDIYGAGAYIQSNWTGSFTALIQAFDNNGNLLESYTEVGLSTNQTPGTAIYLGVERKVADISKIKFSLTAASMFVNEFAISSVNVSSATAVPEPETYSMLFAGLFLSGLLLGRNRQ